MINEEKLINNLKRRKLRISACILMILLSSTLFFYTLFFSKKVVAHVSEDDIRAMITDAPIEDQIPQLLNYFHKVEAFNSKLLCDMYFSALGIGIFLAALIIECVGRPKDRLLISLWEKVNELEKRNI